MQWQYRLVKPIQASGLETGQAVTIPAGALVVLLGITPGTGRENAWWNGRSVIVNEQDLADKNLRLV